MYRWAKRAWTSLNQIEKQALLRPTFTPFLPPSSAKSLHPVSLNKHEDRLLGAICNDIDVDDPYTMKRVIREYKIMGIETPIQNGGMGQSPYFHSKLIQRLATMDRDGNWLHQIMVPNSLGPSQLIIQHGTQDQKEKYLSALADGTKTPCFALTGPYNGSDAGAIPETGVIVDGEKIRFSCEKRWITLSPISNLLGVAVRVRDVGITLLLIDLDEVDVDKIRIYRHYPIGSSFPNGYIQISDLEVPINTAVIGGKNGLGQGWKMLMNCLQHGRGISLPSAALGGTSSVLWHSLFYSSVRQQFKNRLIDIYGVQRMLSEIVLRWYMSHTLNEFYHALVARGHHSSSLSAIMKWTLTSMHREAVLNGMDIFGGKGITMGPKNPIAHFYLQNPISITVEGTNCLTQHVIVPVQSIFEHHPYFLQIVNSLEKDDARAFYSGVGHILLDITTSILKFPFRRSSSSLSLYQYRCLVEGARLRTRQDLCRTLANLTVAHVMTEAIEWKFHDNSYPLLKSLLLRFVQERWLEEKMVVSLSVEEAGYLSRCVLQNRGLMDILESDIVEKDPVLLRVCDFWRQQGHFDVPPNLHEEVISVDRYDIKDHEEVIKTK